MSAGLRHLLLGGLCVYVCVVFAFLFILQQNTDPNGNPQLYRNSKSLVPFQRVNSSESRPTKSHHKGRSAKPGLQTKTLTVPNSKKRKLQDSVDGAVSSVNTNFMPLFENHYVYSAFVDDRQVTAYIRIIAVGHSGKGKRHSGFFCQFGKSDKRPDEKVITSKLVYYETCESHLMRYSFYIMSCELPDTMLEYYLTSEHSYVTIIKSENSTQSGIVLPVLNNKVQQTFSDDVTFAMCIPPLFGNINVLRFVEFIELSRLLGSEHFTFYDHGVSQDIKSVLRFYQKTGVVTVLPWSVPINSIWYNAQSAAIGDCLFRNMYRYQFVAFNDIDEFILPRKAETWEDMLEFIHVHSAISPEDTAVYRFRSSFFIPGNERKNSTQLPKEYKLFVSQNNTYRTMRASNIRTKLLVNPIKVFELGIHHLSKPIDDKFVTLNVDPQVALLHHYRKCDAVYDMSCAKYEKDTTAWRYTTSLIARAVHALKQIQHVHSTFNTSVAHNL